MVIKTAGELMDGYEIGPETLLRYINRGLIALYKNTTRIVYDTDRPPSFERYNIPALKPLAKQPKLDGLDSKDLSVALYSSRRAPSMAQRTEVRRQTILEEMRESRGQSTGEKSRMPDHPEGFYGLSFTLPKNSKKEVEIINLIREFKIDEAEFLKYHRSTKNTPAPPTSVENTQQRAQACLNKLIEDGFHPKDWKELLSHPEMQEAMKSMSSEPKKREYLRPIVKGKLPHLCKGGRPAKKVP